MSCCGPKLILLQVVVISAVGLGAGLIDSYRRPLKLGRDAPPDLPTTTNTTPDKPTTTTTTKPPTPTLTVATTNLKPGDEGWKPTVKELLPKGQITLDDAKRLFDTDAKLIDARRKEDYEAGHIKGAIRLNLKSFENGDPPLLAMIPRDSFVIVYCSGGNCDESEHVAEFLSNSGYKKVYVIHDGYPGWNAMGWPVETGEGIQ